jgi:hypothetical protein
MTVLFLLNFICSHGKPFDLEGPGFPQNCSGFRKHPSNNSRFPDAAAKLPAPRHLVEDFMVISINSIRR